MKIFIFLATLTLIYAEDYCNDIFIWKREYIMDAPAPKNIKSSAGKIFFTETGGDVCRDVYTCFDRVLQVYESNNVQDNFYIGGDGLVYEGLGWKSKNRRYDQFENELSVAFIGDFNGRFISQNMTSTAKSLILCGVQQREIDYFFSVYTDNDLNCIKNANGIYEEMSQWTTHAADGELISC